MQTKKISTEELRDLKIATLARKHNCSADYVTKILTGDRKRNSVLSQKILTDAIDILEIINRETKVTL